MTYQTPAFEADDHCPEDFIRRIDAYLDGQMDNRQMDVFEQVYFSNDACLEALRLRRQVRDLVSSEGEVLFADLQLSTPLPSPAAALARPAAGGSAASWWLIAAAVLLLAGLTAWQTLLTGSSARPAGGLAAVSPAGADDPLYARSPRLEKIHARQQRSGVMPPVALPLDDVQYGRNLRFGSMEKALPSQLDLSILSNSGEVLYRYRLIGGQFVFDEELPAGLYYWLLEDERETLAAGRFIVSSKP